MKARADQSKAGVLDRGPCLLQLAQHVIGPVADTGLQLDLFGEDLRRDPARECPLDRVEHRLRLRNQLKAIVDE